jgi:hypothetical protein
VSFWCFASSLGTWSCFLVARMYWYGVWDATSVRVLSISLLLPIQLLGRDYYFSNVLLLACSGRYPSYFVRLNIQDRPIFSTCLMNAGECVLLPLLANMRYIKSRR